MKNNPKTQEEIFKQFKEFDFDNSEEFHKYLENIFPYPKGLLMEKIKRKYFKNNIDKNFEINFDDINKKVNNIIS